MPTDQPGSLAAALIQLQARLPRITKDATGQAADVDWDAREMSD